MMFDPQFQSLPEQAKKIVLERLKAKQAAESLVAMQSGALSGRQSTRAESVPPTVVAATPTKMLTVNTTGTTRSGTMKAPSNVSRSTKPNTIGGTAALPNGWTRHLDKNHGRIYYHNNITRRSTWTHPAELDIFDHAIAAGSPKSKQRNQ